jgi:hypothetical protein
MRLTNRSSCREVIGILQVFCKKPFKLSDSLPMFVNKLRKILDVSPYSASLVIMVRNTECSNYLAKAIIGTI